jgi:hypothetical protein
MFDFQELSNQAKASVPKNLAPDAWIVEYNKIFGLLVVKECCELVEGFEITQEVALDEYVDYEASDVLKQHFGIK